MSRKPICRLILVLGMTIPSFSWGEDPKSLSPYEIEAAARREKIRSQPLGVITFDVDRSGSVSKKEFLFYHEGRIRNQFRYLDQDGSKGLKTQEIRELAHPSMRQPTTPEAAKSKVTVLTFDANRDGTVSQDEFIQSQLDRMSRQFDKLDTNQNGTLDATETLYINRPVPQSRQRPPIRP